MILVLAPDTVWYRMHSTNAVRKVSPFIEGIYVLWQSESRLISGDENAGLKGRPGLGGDLYWTKTAMRAGLYRDGFILLASGWWMISGVTRRGTAWLVGRKP